MTVAPKSILAAREIVKAKTGLPYVSLGIVGDPAHRGGYHCGRDRTTSPDYSVNESPRDAKPTDASCALDVGPFTISAGGKSHTLRTFSVWLAAQCAKGTPDTADIREVIYSPDGKTVKRWDRLGRRSTGDSSHLSHTHISWHRDSEARDKTAVFKRYFAEIAGAPAAAPTGADDMPTPKDLLDFDDVPNLYGDAATNPKVQVRTALKAALSTDVKMDGLNAKLDKLTAAVTALSGKDFTDEAEIARQVLAGLTPAAIAAAIPNTVARDVVDTLTKRLQA